jgi:hypothetical protein
MIFSIFYFNWIIIFGGVQQKDLGFFSIQYNEIMDM